MTNSPSTFNTLVAEALAYDFSGWDFSWSAGRWQEEAPPWDYASDRAQATGRCRAVARHGYRRRRAFGGLGPAAV